jgi:hypothetical protein
LGRLANEGAYYEKTRTLHENLGERGSGNRLFVSNGGLAQCDYAEIGRNAVSAGNGAILTGNASRWTMPGIFFLDWLER